MFMRICPALAAPFLAAALIVACSDSSGPSSSASLDAVSPAPNAADVSTGTSITLTFGQPLMGGMEQYMDLHLGDVTGPTMPMTCAWSPDMTTLTCTPNVMLSGGTQYTIHVGAGMTDAQGHHVGMGEWQGMGGTWCTADMMGGMMNGMHNGQPVGMMGPGWKHNEHYGMLFSFTTS